ncbi:DUF2975 domain-containing protein [uncultured Algibacter sp.]|uniref:DUF2975 domain-containing protein n=1 Tax=uncultured Algibacter sp. TaxID=298659 RepID=UPI00262DBA4B|nr:DUF2975 domain-containing protein [uncultured Algibacter sp.]
MKKINFLNGFVKILIIVFMIHFVTSIYLTFFAPDFINISDEFHKNSIFGYYTQFMTLTFSIITFIGLIFIQRGLGITIKNGFFNKGSGLKFKTAGKLFLISGVLSLIFDLMIAYQSENIVLFGNLGLNLLLMIVGFSLHIISDIIQNGSLIKQENDLTI